MKKKTVMVFGVFDGIHEGHRFFLREARGRGDYLIAVASKDNNVKELKKHLPRFPLSKRISHLMEETLADEVVAGDDNINSWNVLKRHRPDIICLGYDQTALATALAKHIKKENLPIALATITPYQPGQFHSSRTYAIRTLRSFPRMRESSL